MLSCLYAFKSSIFKGNRRFPFEPSFIQKQFRNKGGISDAKKGVSFAEYLRFPLKLKYFFAFFKKAYIKTYSG